MAKNVYIGDSNNLARKVKDIFVGVETYFPVEYIKSSGTQYIDTGYLAKGDLKVITDIEYTSTISNNQFIYGGRDSATLNNNSVLLQLQSNHINFRNDYNTANSATTYISNLLTKWHIVKDKGDLTITSSDGQNVSKTLPNATFSSSYNVYIFGCNNASNILNTASYRLYTFKMYDNDTLVRDFIPCIDENNVACLYDKISGKAFYNSGTGSFTYGNRTSENPIITNKRVIKAYVGDSNNVARECYNVTYTPVNYLRSSGTQWINTGIKALKTRTELSFKLPTIPTNSSWVYFAGAYGENDNRYYICGLDASRNIISQDKSGTKITLMSGNDTNQHIIIYNTLTNKVIFDNVEKGTISDLTEETANPIALFCRDEFQAPPQALDIYYCKIYDNETDILVRDIIPVLDSDNVPCMYDKITKTFFYNQGTGTFNYG